jgi:hypothetical protein
MGSAELNQQLSVLEELRKELTELNQRLDDGLTTLNELAQRVGQDAPEYERRFADWLILKDDYERVCDRVIVLEARVELAEWVAKLPPPKASARSTDGRKQL